MGELDLCKDCDPYTPFDEGIRSAMLTVFFAWLPVAIAGLLLARTRAVHATMRGAGPLRVLARLAITILVAATAFPLMMIAMYTLHAATRNYILVVEAFQVLMISLAFLAPVAALSAAGIRAWHRVLLELTSHPGEGRMLV
jgi:hypothetical protein